MTEWRRVVTDTLCGYCGHSIPKGDPARYTKIGDIRRERVRCADCVGPAPPDLPPLIERSREIPATFRQVTSVLPGRTRGALKTIINNPAAPREEWMPYRDEP